MKCANKWGLCLFMLWTPLLHSQDIETFYEQAKAALKAADHQTALQRVEVAKKTISEDPRLDPNGVFMKKLLPLVEVNGQNMAAIMLALEELYQTAQEGITFPDLSPNLESVGKYYEQAREASEELMRRRDEVLASRELAPEYKGALYQAPILARIEKLASTGIMEKLTGKFSEMVGVLTDSLGAVDNRYKMAEVRMQKLVKSSAANKSEIDKVKKEIARLSEERLSYINTISEMLAGEASAEKEPIRVALTDNQVDDVFRGVIQSEISRVQSATDVDSTAFKNMLNNYERIQNYNRIFARNRIAPDQSALLASYEAALKAVKINEPSRKINWTIIYVLLVIAALILLLLLYRFGAGKKTTAKTTF